MEETSRLGGQLPQPVSVNGKREKNSRKQEIKNSKKQENNKEQQEKNTQMLVGGNSVHWSDQGA